MGACTAVQISVAMHSAWTSTNCVRHALSGCGRHAAMTSGRNCRYTSACGCDNHTLHNPVAQLRCSRIGSVCPAQGSRLQLLCLTQVTGVDEACGLMHAMCAGTLLPTHAACAAQHSAESLSWFSLKEQRVHAGGGDVCAHAARARACRPDQGAASAAGISLSPQGPALCARREALLERHVGPQEAALMDRWTAEWPVSGSSGQCFGRR